VSSTGSEPEMPLEPAPILARTGMEQARRTILLVEDEEFVRHVTGEVLSFAGYQVFGARNAAEAMRVFQQCGERVQLLLTDVVLPGRNGRDLARDLHALCPGLKTMFISGYPENEVRQHGVDEPGTFYLPKPFSVESLIQKVRQALEADGLAAPLAKHAAGSGSPA
jgi:two-component system, cell cycle sensor histidine kinase and response regulator CckA